jgi:tricorn protease
MIGRRALEDVVMRIRSWSALGLGVVFVAVAMSARAEVGYYRHPALRGDTLVFTAEGDLWRVPVAGGTAMRLTTHPGEESQAAISADGRRIAFVASYDGVPDVYVMPMAGGVPKRLSADLGSVFVHGFAPDGRVAYSTDGAVGPGRSRRIRLVDPDTLRTEELPLADANEVAFDTQGRIVFSRFGLQVTGDHARDYRGGALGQLWRFTPGGDAEAVRVAPAHAANLAQPMIDGDALYAVSDAEGAANLVHVGEEGSIEALTTQRDFDVRQAAIDGGRIVYQLGADLHLFDIAARSDRIVPIEHGSDFLQARDRRIGDPLKYVADPAPAGQGERVALVTRGRIFVAGLGPLRRIEVPMPEGARATAAQIAPDGRSVYAILQIGAASEVWRLPLDGRGARALTQGDGARRWHLWLSPDGTTLAHDDQRRRLWLTDTNSGQTREVDRTEFGGDDVYAGLAWSADARHLAYVRPDSALQRTQLVLMAAADGAKIVLGSDRFESTAPAFSPDGRWLYFLSARSFAAPSNSVWDDRSTGPVIDRRVRIYAHALQPDPRFPFAPRDELAPKSEDPKEETKTDTKSLPQPVFAGLRERLYVVPVAAGNYAGLAVNDKFLYTLEAANGPAEKSRLRSIAISAEEAKVEAFAEDVDSFALSSDGTQLFFAKPGNDEAATGPMYFVEAAAKAGDNLGKREVRVGDWTLPLDPRAEWRQMFVDAWTMHRQFAFDAAMRGVDWDEIRARYEPLTERVTDRAELADLLAQMSAHFGALHSQVRGGDLRQDPAAPKPARLGARFVAVEGGLRIERLYRTDPELPEERGPLQQPGIDVREGDVLLRVNARAVTDEIALSEALANQAGQQVLLDLRRGETELQRVVVPVPAERDAQLRYSDWLEGVRGKVAARDPRIGYLHLRAMGGTDMAGFVRDFYANYDQQGLIIDVRRNRGGNIDSWIIEKLLRQRWAYWQKPGESAGWNMQQSFRGHLVVLADQLTYSDGETFTAGIRALGLGPVLGMRTAGAGVWLSDRNALIDGGGARVPEYPQFDTQGRWLIEARGVAPDVEVDNLPYATGSGGDAQLDAALDLLERKLHEVPIETPRSEPLPPRARPGLDHAEPVR